MELFGHQTPLFARLLEEGLSKKEALEFIKEHGVKMMLVDNLRPAVNGDDVAPKGRGYSHFTDRCSMVLPFGEALKDYTDIHQTTFEHGEGYRNKFADEPTDFAKFIRMNPDMFTPENQDWGIFTLAHLEQDVNSDGVWQRMVCACDTENDRVDYVFTGKVVDGATFRKDMIRANIYMHTMFVGYIRNVLKCDIQEQEFLEAVSLPRVTLRWIRAFLTQSMRIWETLPRKSSPVACSVPANSWILSLSNSSRMRW